MRLIGRAALACSLAGAVAVFAAAGQAQDKREFSVVGTWGNLSQWQNYEQPFWTETLPAISNGQLTANAKPYEQLGVSGFEVMKLLRLGTFDFAHALFSYVASDSPAMEGVDLAGVVQDLGTYRKVVDAYRPILERELDQKFNAKLLMIYTFPSQQLWCNLGQKSNTDVSLASLAGKKIRAYSTTLGDFIEGIDGTAVTLAFAEVVPALEKGVADCGITGTLPAYSAKWWQVVTHNIRVRVGYTATFLAVNKRTWASMTPEQQQTIETALAKLEDEVWAGTIEEDRVGMACNADGPCPLGEPGGMTPIEPSAADQAKLKDVMQNVVLKRWANRCGQKCVDEWNATIGEVVGLEAAL